MGYEIRVDKSKILIKKENFYSIVDAIASIPHRMAWTERNDIQHIAKIRDIAKMFEYLWWPVEFDRDGNISHIEYAAPEHKIGDEEVWLEAISPYVEYCCIQVSGEDGDLWRWIISDGKFRKIRPEIKWNLSEVDDAD